MTRGRLTTLKSPLRVLDTRIVRTTVAGPSAADQAGGRGRAGEFSQWYSHSRWRTLRAKQLQKEPLCVYCDKQGKVTAADTVNHKIPHRGDRALFLDPNNLESTCKHCHDSVVKRLENGGTAPAAIGLDGWPVDTPAASTNTPPGKRFTCA